MDNHSPFVRSKDHRRIKRAVLAPFGRVAIRLVSTRLPTPLRLGAARLVALPYLGVVNRPYERDVRQGRFAGATTDMLQALVYLFGVWEPVLTELLHRRLQPGDTFIDVGANSGWYTTLAASVVGPTGRVVAIEASPALAAMLRAQVERNDLSNVVVVEAAASDAAGTLHVEPGPAQHTGLTRVRAEGDGTRVPADRLSALVGAGALAAARIIKIDVEGAEYAVVRGLETDLAALAPDVEVIVEVGPERASGPDEVGALFTAFEQAGFHPYFLPNDYRVRAYVTPEIPAELIRLDPSTVTTEVNVLFSRVDARAVPM